MGGLSRRTFLTALGATAVSSSGFGAVRAWRAGRRSARSMSAELPARRSDEMADMIGVVVHLTGDPAGTPADRQSDYLYSRFRDRGPGGGPGWMTLIAGAGFRHVRCDTGGGVVPLETLNHQFALETMRLLDNVKPAHSPPSVRSIDKTYLSGSSGLDRDLPVLRSYGGRIWMIEGPNEAWLPNGKFTPAFVSDGQSVYLCLHSVACADATAPRTDPERWLQCRPRGPFDAAVPYGGGDLVDAHGRLWAARPTHDWSVRSAPPADDWWDLTPPGSVLPFRTDRPGIYAGFDRAGECGVAWGEYIAGLLAADSRVADGYWTRAGKRGSPTRIATQSEGGADIYQFWDRPGDQPLLERYRRSMPGGATNVHLYAGGQPADPSAVCAKSLADAARVLPGYPVYLGEVGQATYPTDDALALGGKILGSRPTRVVATGSGSAPLDQAGRPMPGTTTGRFGAEAAQAQHITRTWAEMFLGAPSGSRLAVYELLNEPFNGYRDYAGEWGYPAIGGPFHDYNRSEGNFGLLRSDLSPKPAFTAIANTCELMGDAGTQGFTPDGLAFRVERSGLPRPGAEATVAATDGIGFVLTQGSDRLHRIAVWYRNVRATQEWSPGMRLNAMVAPEPSELMTIRLGSKASRIDAFNTQLSSRRPVESARHTDAISWTLTADLWIVTVRR